MTLMTHDPARALVLGGTGHIGNAIVRELLSRGIAVTVASRRSSPTPNLQGLPVEFVPAHGDRPWQAGEHVAGHDLVIDAAAPYPLRIFDRSRPFGMEPLQYAAHRCDALIAAVRRTRSRLALVGSFTTLRHPGTLASRMEVGLLARLHPYFEVKRQIEAAVLAAAARGLPALVVNPTAVLGPWDCKDPALCFLPLTLNGRLPFRSTRVVNVIDVREVASGLVRAVLAGCFGTRIPLCGHNVRLSELTAQACALGAVNPPRMPASTRYGAALALWGDVGWGLLGIDSPVPSLPILLARYSYPMVPGELQRRLEVVPRPLAATLRDAIKWYASAGYLKRTPARTPPSLHTPSA